MSQQHLSHTDISFPSLVLSFFPLTSEKRTSAPAFIDAATPPDATHARGVHEKCQPAGAALHVKSRDYYIHYQAPIDAFAARCLTAWRSSLALRPSPSFVLSLHVLKPRADKSLGGTNQQVKMATQNSRLYTREAVPYIDSFIIPGTTSPCEHSPIFD